jgi:N-sulfoglucosamine sulfohydrolase
MINARCAVACLCLVPWAIELCSAADRPNFVVFILDDHGWADCSVNGAKDVRTPNMHRLAAEGLTFTHAFVASPTCAPSRAALLTGLMPARNGAEPNHSKPRPEIKKLPAYLQELGYEVAAFGKVAHYNHGPDYGFDRVGGEGFHNHAGIEEAVDLLKTRSKAKPLCLFVGTNWPHVPWPETEAYQPDKVQVPPTHVDTAETRHWRARYYDAVTRADEHLGTILAAAREHLDPENTYFFCTSDHGAQWPFGKWNLYDAGVRVPLLVAGPGIEAGTRSDALVSWIDLLPTLVDLAGGRPSDSIDGRSFAGVIRGQSDKHREAIYTTHSGDGRFNVYPIRSVRTPDWKYILNLRPEYQHATHINRAAAGDGLRYWQSWEAAATSEELAAAIVARYKQRPREELYVLASDPHEEHNLAPDPRHAQRLSAMREMVVAWMKAQGDAGRVYGEPLLLGQEATPIRPAGKKK